MSPLVAGAASAPSRCGLRKVQAQTPAAGPSLRRARNARTAAAAAVAGRRRSPSASGDDGKAAAPTAPRDSRRARRRHRPPRRRLLPRTAGSRTDAARAADVATRTLEPRARERLESGPERSASACSERRVADAQDQYDSAQRFVADGGRRAQREELRLCRVLRRKSCDARRAARQGG